MDRLTRLHSLAVEKYREGTSKRWVACLAANHIVGLYKDGATLALAADLHVDKRTVQNLARAGETYINLRPYCKELPEYRRLLSYTHFQVMGDAIRAYDIPVNEAVEQLKTAASEGASVRQMVQALRGEYGDDVGRNWQYKLRSIRKLCDDINSEFGAPDYVREECNRFILFIDCTEQIND